MEKVGRVGRKLHKWRGREQNRGTLSVPYASLGAKRDNDDDDISSEYRSYMKMARRDP